MKEYPSLTNKPRNDKIFAFYKLDGSNLRAEWMRKRHKKEGDGWYKFGKRHGLIGEDYNLGKGIGLFKEKYGDALAEVFVQQRWDRVTVYFEFWGPASFAGQHEEGDAHTVSLFDVNVHKKGFILPQDFMKLFGHLEVAKLLYTGNCNSDFVDQVKEGVLPGLDSYPGVVPEGVVCKGAYETPGRPLMFKVKTAAWVEKLRDYCSGDVKLFDKLL